MREWCNRGRVMDFQTASIFGFAPIELFLIIAIVIVVVALLSVRRNV